MARLIDPFEQFFDSSGAPLFKGKLWFFESGGSSAAKGTFADSAETIANSNPVILSADGRAPNVFGSGTYRVILTDNTDVQILQRDPVGGETGITFGADWISTQIYGSSDVVRDDGDYWISLIPSNQNIRPSTDGGSNWVRYPNDILNATIVGGTVTSSAISGSSFTNGTMDGTTIGATTPPVVTNLGSVATCDINGGTIDGIDSLSVAADSSGNVSRYAMSTAGSATANYYAKLKTWTVSTAAIKYGAERFHLETTDKSPVASADIEAQIITDATGTIDTTNSKVLVNHFSGDGFASDGFFLVQPAAGTVELWVQIQTTNGQVHVQELAADNQADSEAYNDGAAWQVGAPSGTTVTSDWTPQPVAPAVTGFTSSEIVYIDDDGDSQGGDTFDVDAAIGGAWESVGPTGSGATNIWTALDALPLSAAWVDISLYNQVQDAGGVPQQIVYIRRTGATSGVGVETIISIVSQSGPTAAMYNNATKKVALDTSNRFDIFRSSNGTTFVCAASLVDAGV